MAAKKKTISSCDVFDVGKLQLWSWAGYGRSRNGMPGVRCVGYDTMRKGAYVIVELQAIFGCLANVPAIVASATSLRSAKDMVRSFDSVNPCGGIASDFEIWHILADDDVYGAGTTLAHYVS